MKKINWKFFNIALWSELILAYLLPFKKINEFHSQIGFPFPFISVYDTALGVNPFSSMYLNPAIFLLDGMIVYLIISYAVIVFTHIRKKR